MANIRQTAEVQVHQVAPCVQPVNTSKVILVAQALVETPSVALVHLDTTLQLAKTCVCNVVLAHMQTWYQLPQPA